MLNVLLVSALHASQANPSPAPSPAPSVATTFPPQAFQPTTEYYSAINPSAVNDDLKGQLKALINPHKVLDYDTVWSAFADTGPTLPGYPCNSDKTHIPDIYSSYCWTLEQNMSKGGECGNYAKEGDCFNREHIWPKSWYVIGV